MTRPVMFITGAGSGLGQLTAQRALREGWAVAAIDVNSGGLDQLGLEPHLLKVICDITDPLAVAEAVDHCEATLGPIVRCVNAAAIMPLGELLEQPLDLQKRVMDINYGGLLNVVQAALPRMLARQQGEFVSYASMAGHWPMIYMGAYNAAKHAVVAYTEVLHHETQGSGVRIACVCPPIVATPLLNQAKSTTWPKIFNVFPPLTPESVVSKVDGVLKSGGFWVFPGPLTRVSWVLRRWFPSIMWRAVHLIERR